MHTPQLVIAGNLLVDDIVLADGRTRMGEPGGAVLYGALAAALWEVSVGIVSVHGDDYPRSAIEALDTRGVDLSGLHPLGTPGLRTWLLYEPHGRRVVHQLGGATHETMSPAPADVPRTFVGARAIHLAPMPIECQQALVAGLRPRLRDGVLSLDPHESVREDNQARWRELLAQLDLFFLGEDEMQLAGSDSDPRAALERLHVRDDGYVVFKRGANGGLVRWQAREGACIFDWSARTARVVDPTGAGDAFAAGFLAGLVREEPEGLCCARALVSASFALEDWGAHGLLAATPALAAQRLETWFPLVRRHTRP